MTLAPSEPGRIAVAVEVPRGAVVDTLLERGIHVFSLNPTPLDRFRDRHTVAEAKDDLATARVKTAHACLTDAQLAEARRRLYDTISNTITV